MMPGMSAAEGEADQIGGKANIGDGISEVGGIPDLNRTWPRLPLLARSGHFLELHLLLH